LRKSGTNVSFLQEFDTNLLNCHPEASISTDIVIVLF